MRSLVPIGSRSINGSKKSSDIDRGTCRKMVNNQNIQASLFTSKAGIFP
jgi:hypothetical protein